MKWRALIVVTLLIDVSIIHWSLAADDDSNTLSNDNSHATSTDEQKFILECQHSDYRTYIKCLKRQKRHHGHVNHHNNTDDTKTCFEDCGMDQCTSTKCVHDCHTRCMKKTKETRQIITQYETECTSGDCNKSELPITNITSNIDINNIINNHIAKDIIDDDSSNKCKPGNCCSGCCGGCSQNIPSSPSTSSSSGFGLTLIPQIQLVPQITYGIGLGPIGGCLFSMNWPCMQSTQTMNQPMMPFDCSQCGNPVFRYKCDISCYNVQSGSTPDLSSHDGNNRSSCKSPNCIGGSQQ
ncbi:hypothetical protein PV325_013963 [Microctonus aethiopoides]|uniref:Uncharacterized protein n=1 Tax=Microctonus aethiopoides TaxID=144406 RepID=A0AA39FI63_9HYME|nr:hypothetical protein PV325_013963 [Microctonus aethiopoides]KAK0093669.1 hypothetical protein PV326_012940 [Microctonus aethiopoides]KAK0170042.1 hypothetical protein PV328_010654 [Microctonus aethiopoides]